jgi:hypothetical protein
MSLGIISRSFKRGRPHSGTIIDGLPVVLKAGSVHFVDGNLSAGGDGSSFLQAYSTIQAAVDRSAQDDTIYIRPKPLGTYYTESVIVPPTTHRGLAIIGTGHGRGGSVYSPCTWRNSSDSVDDSALTARAGHMNIENVNFFSRAAQELGWAIKAYWNTGSGLNIGSAIVNCGFTTDLADHPAAAGLVQSAVRLDSNEGISIEGNKFVDCRVGIAAGSTMNAWKDLLIRDNVFSGLAANIAADLFLSDGMNASIIGNHFGHTKPSHAAGTMTEYIFQIGGTTLTGFVSGNFFAMTSTAKADTGNTDALVFAGNFSAGGVLST